MSLVRHIPNIVTVGRGLAGPAGAFLLLSSYSATTESAAVEYGLAAFIVFAIAALSDAVDGWLARLLNAESAWGALLDPIADKLLVGSYLIAFVIIFQFSLFLMLPVAVILVRDLTVTGLRLTSDKPSALAATTTAKLKTAFQMGVVALPFLVVMLGPHSDTAMAVYALFWQASVWFLAILTVWTAWPYWRAARQAKAGDSA